jgi:hypothetical protein
MNMKSLGDDFFALAPHVIGRSNQISFSARNALDGALLGITAKPPITFVRAGRRRRRPCLLHRFALHVSNPDDLIHIAYVTN